VLLVAAQSKHQNSGFYDDIERFRAQLQHFLFVYGWSAGELSKILRTIQTRAYDPISGANACRRGRLVRAGARSCATTADHYLNATPPLPQ